MAAEADLPPDVAALLHQILLAGEKVAWVAQPAPALAVRGALVVALLGVAPLAFGALVMAMAIFSALPDLPRAYAAGRTGEAVGLLAIPLFAAVFIAAGLAMMAWPWFAVRRARRTVCAVTGFRALTVRFPRDAPAIVESWSASEIGAIDPKARADGAGDLWFVQGLRQFADGRVRPGRKGFIGIPDVAGATLAVRRLKGLKP